MKADAHLVIFCEPKHNWTGVIVCLCGKSHLNPQPVGFWEQKSKSAKEEISSERGLAPKCVKAYLDREPGETVEWLYAISNLVRKTSEEQWEA